jgi:hypothetical protein
MVLLIIVVALALLPAAVGLGWSTALAGQMVTGLGGLAAAIGGAKLLTAIWVWVAQASEKHAALSASASID